MIDDEEQWECPECGFQNFGDTCARCLRYRDEEDLMIEEEGADVLPTS